MVSFTVYCPTGEWQRLVPAMQAIVQGLLWSILFTTRSPSVLERGGYQVMSFFLAGAVGRLLSLLPKGKAHGFWWRRLMKLLKHD